VDDFRLGTAIRLVRQRRGLRQQDLADKARVSQSVVSRIERGHAGSHSVETIRAIAAVLEIRVDLVPRWRAGDLDRLLNSRHSALHESVARMFRDQLPTWILAPEVSFAIYGERGVIDILAWHPGRRALLVIELKTDLADMNELVGTFDRKRRLAREVAAARRWDPASVSAWLIISATRTNRRRVEAHEAMLRAALPDDGRTIRHWLRDPVRAINALSFWTDTPGETGRPASRPVRRVRAPSTRTPERGSGAGGPATAPRR
jgi:transcriptional regulator with XRE-family HTH domain